MKKLLTYILLCCMTILLSSCSSVSQIKNKTVKVNENISGQELYVFSHYKGSFFTHSTKYGYMNSKGKVFIEPCFDYAEDFTEGFAKVKVNEGFGILNDKGQYVLEPEYPDCKYIGNRFIAFKNSKWGIKGVDGHKLNDNTYEDIQPFSEGLAAAKVNGKWGFINTSGESVIKPQFDFVSTFKDGLCDIQVNDKWGLVTAGGIVVVAPSYEERIQVGGGFIVVKDANGKWGYIDKYGNTLAGYNYETAKAFNEGLAAVNTGGKWGYINQQGNMTIRPSYEEASPFILGLAKVKKDNKYWYINPAGEVIKEVGINYTNFPEFKEGMAAIYAKGKYGFINEKMEVVVEPRYDIYKDFNEGFAVVGEQMSGSYDSAYGFIDKEGNWLVEPSFTDAECFKKDMAKVWLSGKMGYINRNGTYVYKDW